MEVRENICELKIIGKDLGVGWRDWRSCAEDDERGMCEDMVN